MVAILEMTHTRAIFVLSAHGNEPLSAILWFEAISKNSVYGPEHPSFVTWRLAGTRWLKDPRIADLFSEALLHRETIRHVHLAWKPKRDAIGGHEVADRR